MIFNRFDFLFLFLPAVVGLFFLPRLRSYRAEILLVASFVFYGASGLEHLVVLLCGIVWVHAVTASDRIVGSRWRLALAAVPPILALVHYKYSAFLVRTLLGLAPEADARAFDLFSSVVLPAGISFFTFQLLSYAIDRYRGDVPRAPSLRTMALYIGFFPQLIAGPILRYRDVAAPIANLTRFRIDREDVTAAIGYIVFGLVSKVLIADTLGSYLEPLTSRPGELDSITCLYVVFAYSFQIYFDFYGYSLIAIGLGRIFGFAFPDNFLRPYEAPNPKEFWRRWHVTLSYWLRDYLYFPLGGNRSYRRNILIVFAACGLWHGAGWTFVVWGLYHAALVIGYVSVRGAWDRLAPRVQVALNFVLVSIGWTLFQFDFPQALQFVRSLVGSGSAAAPDPSPEMWLALAVAWAVAYFVHYERIATRLGRTPLRAVAYSAELAVLLVATLMFVDRSQGFIYFRF